MILNTSFQLLLAYKISFEKSADTLIESPLLVTVSFSLAAFKWIVPFQVLILQGGEFVYILGPCGPF